MGKGFNKGLVPLFGQGQGHCVAVPQSAGDCTSVDCRYGVCRLKVAGKILPVVIIISKFCKKILDKIFYLFYNEIKITLTHMLFT